jgi:predicted TIM-barrel fold metal-dependent hydrolase
MRLGSIGCPCCPPRSSRRAVLKSVAALGAAALLPAAPSIAATPFRIDVHHHIFPRSVMDLQEKLNPKWGKLAPPRPLTGWSPEAMIEEMDKNAVAAVVISTAGPGAWYGDVPGARQITRAWNENTAQIVRDHPQRAGFFALIALPDIEGSLAEIAYALDVLKADGIGLYTSYDGKYPGDPSFAPLFEELNRRKATVFFHPVVAACCAAVVPGIPTNAYELPFDTTRAIASLLFSGTLSRSPDIKFIFSHAGGAMPMLAGRIDDLTLPLKSLRDNVPNGVEYELKRLYVDTAGATSAPALAAAFTLLPESHVLYGSDFPYLTSDFNITRLAKDGFSAERLRGIEGDNARALFPRLRA